MPDTQDVTEAAPLPPALLEECSGHLRPRAVKWNLLTKTTCWGSLHPSFATILFISECARTISNGNHHGYEVGHI